jgi:hypothetical protein
VLRSSHLMSEMEQTADHLVIIGRGRLIADASIQDVMRGEGAQRQVRVRTPSPDRLARALRGRGLRAHPTGDGDLVVERATPETVGNVALIGATMALDADDVLASGALPPATAAGESGVMLGQFALLVLALVTVTQESATGAIGPSLQWTRAATSCSPRG